MRQEELVDVRIELINSTKAYKILEGNNFNRKLDEATVEKYAAAMKRGEWDLSHQGIAIDKNGNVLDGQHRLWAIIKSEVSIRIMVTRGLPPDVIKNIDTQKVRTTGDALSIMSKRGEVDLTGLGGETKRVAEMANVLIGLEQGFMSKTSTDQVTAAVDRYREGMAAAIRELPMGKGIGSAPMRAAIAFAYKTNPEAVDDFSAQFRTGANLSEGSPVLALRNLVLSGRARGLGDRRSLTVKALNAIRFFIQGKSVERLFHSEDVVAFFGRANGVELKGSSRWGAGLIESKMRRAAGR